MRMKYNLAELVAKEVAKYEIKVNGTKYGTMQEFEDDFKKEFDKNGDSTLYEFLDIYNNLLKLECYGLCGNKEELEELILFLDGVEYVQRKWKESLF